MARIAPWNFVNFSSHISLCTVAHESKEKNKIASGNTGQLKNKCQEKKDKEKEQHFETGIPRLGSVSSV